eukprot:CAMPEP_0206612524 /NCGR_PEP_ID=MMETSP0325_2-20121206/56049_1 /ASSEMBLY_ACC=CAM_ASM_000347 /TAXON_ID=2866 /ORGANISM="Crypthecodinium cohnii, Strain Seligo" /LENGTH=35 /DNA_ID= /DNA_START= /DNA_END= /DNA_ORIENTATION=
MGSSGSLTSSYTTYFRVPWGFEGAPAVGLAGFCLA